MTTRTFASCLCTLTLLGLLAGCGGGGESPAPAAEVTAPVVPAPAPLVASATVLIGAAGGTVTGPDGVQVVIPAGVLDAATEIGIARDARGAPELGGMRLLSSVYAVTPHGSQFGESARISIPFNPAEVAPGTRPVIIKSQPGGTWTALVSDPVGSSLASDTSGFSFYAVGTCYTSRDVAVGGPDPLLYCPANHSLQLRLQDGSGVSLPVPRNSLGNQQPAMTVSTATTLNFTVEYNRPAGTNRNDLLSVQVLGAGLLPSQQPLTDFVVSNTVPVPSVSVAIDPSTVPLAGRPGGVVIRVKAFVTYTTDSFYFGCFCFKPASWTFEAEVPVRVIHVPPVEPAPAPVPVPTPAPIPVPAPVPAPPAAPGQGLVLVPALTPPPASAVAPTPAAPAATVPTFSTQPLSVTITAGQSTQFTVAVSGSPTPTLQWQLSTDGGVNWSNITGATGTAFNVINAAAGNDGQQFRAAASNSAGVVNSNPAVLSVTAAAPVTITTSSPLPPGTVNQPYSVTLAASGGTPPFTWGLASGPTFLTLNASTGQLSGTSTAAVATSYGLAIQVLDSSNPQQSANKTFDLVFDVPCDIGFGSTTVAGAPSTVGGKFCPQSSTAPGLPNGNGMVTAVWGDLTRGVSEYVGVSFYPATGQLESVSFSLNDPTRLWTYLCVPNVRVDYPQCSGITLDTVNGTVSFINTVVGSGTSPVFTLNGMLRY